MIRSDRLGLAVLVAMALACSTLSALTADNWLLVGGIIGLTLTAVVGIAGRRLGLAEWTVQLLQLLAGFLFTTGLFAVSDLGDNPLMGLTTIGSEALEHIRVSAAPMSPNAPVRVLGVVLIWLLGWVAEMVVISLARPALVLPFLLTPYLAGSLAIPNDLDFRSFLLVGLGLFLVLLADGLARTAMLRSSGLGVPGLRRAVLAGGAATVLFGVVGAGVAGVVSGESDAGTWEPFRGQGPIQMADPTLDLRRNLEQLDDVVVIRYQTDQPGGVHLRMTTLPVFDAGGWHLDRMQLFGGALPAAPGVSGNEPQRRTQITIADFKTQWLPLPYAPTSFEARGDWRHDDLTLSVLSGGDEPTSTVGLSYTATSLEIAPDVGDMLSAQVGRPRDGATTTTLPGDLPADVSELAREVTRDALSAGERAIAIQEYLRSDRFRYSTEPAPGSGYDALSRFLFVDRVGYCEQFAASMAVLARAVGIPSRVAIGFLPGSRVGEGWEVSIRDMHAWPELYFADFGWVRFEPTPAITGVPPAWTDDGAIASPSPSPSSPTPSSTSDPASTPSPSEEPQAPETGNAGLLGSGPVLLAAGVLCALLAVGGSPWLVRSLRRRQRLGAVAAADRVEGAWEEIRDLVWDAGWEWPTGSVRESGRQLAERLPDGADAAIKALTTWVERSRYADSLGTVPTLTDQVTTVRDALARTRRSGRAPWREVLPRSIWKRFRWNRGA